MIGNPIAGQYLTFGVGDTRYGLDIARVQEIRRLDQVTRLPTAPVFIRGMVNLRGTVVPIVDLRRRFGFPEGGDSERPVVIVVEVQGHTLGLLADQVSEVLDVSPDELHPTPHFGSGIDTSLLSGIALTERGLVALLELDLVLAAGDLERLTVVGG